MTQADGDWLSTKEAAAALGLTPRTLYRLIDEGHLPAYRFGRVIRLKQDEINNFVDRNRIKPGSLEHLYPEARTPEERAAAEQAIAAAEGAAAEQALAAE